MLINLPSDSALIFAVCLNGLITIFVLRLTLWLWRWRYRLQEVAQQLDHSERELAISSQAVRYSLAHRRVQVAQSRLSVLKSFAVWEQRSKQIKQVRQLVRLLQLVLVVRNGR